MPDFEGRSYSRSQLSDEVEVARIRVSVPRTPDAVVTVDDSQIRASASNPQRIITFIHSLRYLSPRIILTPTMSLIDDGAIVVDFRINGETTYGEPAHASQMFWDSVAQQFGFSITEYLRTAIQDQLAL